MAYSYVRYTGNGSTVNYPFSFPTISTDHIKVRVNGTLVTNWSFLNSSTIQFAAAPASSAIIEIRRETPKESAIVNFTDGSVLLERDLDLLATWQLYVAQETEDDLEDTIRVDSQGRFDAQNKRITNVANPVAAQDVVTKNWVETTYTPELEAIALAAASSVTAAAGSATTATAQATNAAASAVSAANSAAAAATALDSFDDRYLGQKASDPAVDNDGNALITGALYYNTTDSAMRVYTGTGWINASSAQVATMKTYVYVATAAQTTFSGNDTNGSSLTYVAPYLIVSLNGLELRPVVDYTATSGLSVVLTAAATAGDELQIQAFSAFNVANIQASNVSFQQTPASTVRSVDVKLKDFVSVKDFGALGDGVADDAPAINLAVDYLVTLGGGTLYFPPGTYLVSRHIKIRDNITYQGSGWGSILRSKSNNLDNVMGDYGPGYDFDIYGVVIRDLQIDGNRANVAYNTYEAGGADDAYQNGIRLHKTKRFLIERCYIHDVVFNAISCYLLSNDGVIRNNLIKNTGKVGNPTSGYSSYMGIFVEYAADNLHIVGNIIDTTRDVGIMIQTAGNGGIRYVNVESNRILNCFANGIYVRDQTTGGVGPLQDIIISKNVITGCATGNTEPAIRTGRQSVGMRASNIVITDNVVEGNNFNGILADTGTERCVIGGNLVTANLGVGITNAGTDVSVMGNVCVGNTTDIISVGAATRASTIGNIDRYSGADGQQGTFTPTVLTGGAAVGRTYSTQSGQYRVNGNRVEFNIQVQISAVGSSAGGLTIGGLPFASKSSGPFASVTVMTGGVTWTSVPCGLIINNESQIRIYGMASGAAANALTEGNLSSSSVFYISGSYAV